MSTARNRPVTVKIEAEIREENREACRQDAIRAWSEYRAAGLHVTQEEADAWLAKLETGKDAGPPICHT